MLKEFKEFLFKGNIVDLAVAVILGAAFGAAVVSFTQDILMQIVGAIFGEPDFSALTIDIGDGQIFYGKFLNALINLVIIGAVLFLVLRAYNKMKKPDAAAGPTEVDLLTEIRDSLRK